MAPLRDELLVPDVAEPVVAEPVVAEPVVAEPVVPVPLVPLVAVPLVEPEPPVDIFAFVRMNDPPAAERDPDAAVSVGVVPLVAVPDVPAVPCAESPDCRQPTTVTWPARFPLCRD
jgi:hypothetical protein